MTSPPGYDNIHYAIMRVILPFMHNQQGMRQLFAELPDETARNVAFSDAFRDYVVDMLELGGITADTEYPPSRNLAWRYAWGTPPTNEFFPANDEEDYLHTGPGGFKMSAVEYAQFLAGFEHGRFLSLSAVRELKDDWLGFDDSKTLVGTAAIGPLYTKNGGSGRRRLAVDDLPRRRPGVHHAELHGQPRGARQHGDAARRLGGRADLGRGPRPAARRRAGRGLPTVTQAIRSERPRVGRARRSGGRGQARPRGAGAGRPRRSAGSARPAERRHRRRAAGRARPVRAGRAAGAGRRPRTAGPSRRATGRAGTGAGRRTARPRRARRRRAAGSPGRRPAGRRAAWRVPAGGGRALRRAARRPGALPCRRAGRGLTWRGGRGLRLARMRDGLGADGLGGRGRADAATAVGDGAGVDHPRICAAAGGGVAGASAASAGTSAAGSSTRTTAVQPAASRRARRSGRREPARGGADALGGARDLAAKPDGGHQRQPQPVDAAGLFHRRHPRRADGARRQVLREPRGVVVQRAVLAEREQREGALAIGRGGGDRAERAAPQPVAEADARAREQLGDRVAVHAHDLGDLVVGQLLQLAQRERLALARGERRVGGADLLLMRLEQHLPLRPVWPRARPTPPGRRSRGSRRRVPRGAGGRSRRSWRGARP